MDDDRDLQNFSGLCRLFPLPEVVLFPHAILPLHVFEPRYRQMTEDALAGDGLLTMAQLRDPSADPAGALGAPPVEVFGGLGRIIQHERLPDGRFHLLLLGRRRVRLLREVPTDKLYRVAEAEILDDVGDTNSHDSRRGLLIELFRHVWLRERGVDREMTAIVQSPLPLGTLTDIIGHALGLPPAQKQALLAEPHVGRRVDHLIGVLRPIVRRSLREARDGLAFPPPFSAN
jgi:Lon protease-like protein